MTIGPFPCEGLVGVCGWWNALGEILKMQQMTIYNHFHGFHEWREAT